MTRTALRYRLLLAEQARRRALDMAAGQERLARMWERRFERALDYARHAAGCAEAERIGECDCGLAELRGVYGFVEEREAA